MKGLGDRRLALNASSADGSVDEEGIGSGLVDDESPEPGCEVTVGEGLGVDGSREACCEVPPGRGLVIDESRETDCTAPAAVE